jgi:spectinomycin phosphotransferase
MLTPPDLSDDTINACVYAHFGLHIAHTTFLPIGADVNSAVYRVTSDDGTPYFLKLRRGHFNEVAVTVPALLHAHGIHHVMAPLATTTGAWWVQMDGFAAMLYPFFEGKNGFAKALSPAQWVAFGSTMHAVHTTRLPAELEARMPREAYAPHYRSSVQAFHQQVKQCVYDDPIAACLAAFWRTKHEEISHIMERAEQLAHVLQQHTGDLVVCHADLHAGNVLVGADDVLAIVDWDELILAPKERDLMFVGAGIGGVWTQAQEAAWFYAGYGDTTINPRALAYYRYERIVADIAAYAEQIFGMQGSTEDREQGLHELMGQFHPNSVVDIAHRSYLSLA